MRDWYESSLSLAGRQCSSSVLLSGYERTGGSAARSHYASLWAIGCQACGR